MKYNLIDENGRIAYKEMTLDQIRILADANNYEIMYGDSEPYSIGPSNMCGISKKLYSIVADTEDEEEKYNLIDKNGKLVYTAFTLSAIKDLAKRSGYRLCYRYGRPISIEHMNCLKGKVYDVVPIYTGIQIKDKSCSRFNAICSALSDLYARKNQDYGDSFHETFEKYGITMAAIRLGDKLNRFERLISKEAAVKDESVVDTLKDLAAYTIMTLMELEKTDVKDEV